MNNQPAPERLATVDIVRGAAVLGGWISEQMRKAERSVIESSHQSAAACFAACRQELILLMASSETPDMALMMAIGLVVRPEGVDRREWESQDWMASFGIPTPAQPLANAARHGTLDHTEFLAVLIPHIGFGASQSQSLRDPSTDEIPDPARDVRRTSSRFRDGLPTATC